MIRKSLLFYIVFILSILFASSKINAQCSVCASNAESSVKDGQKKAGLGLNTGIIVLLTMPYALVTVIGVVWYTNKRSRKRKMIH